MQQKIQLHTGSVSNSRLDAVQRYVDSLVQSVQEPVLRSGGLSGITNPAYGTDVIDLDKKDGHSLESDIASTRIYPKKHIEIVSQAKAVFDADAVRSIYENALSRSTDGFVWACAALYQVFLFLDGVSERAIRGVASVWNTTLERIVRELNLNKDAYASIPVPASAGDHAVVKCEETLVDVIEVFEQPDRPSSLDTLVFALEETADSVLKTRQENSIRSQESSGDGEQYEGTAEQYSETARPMGGYEVDRVTIGGVAKALYLDLRYGPPHLR